MNQSIKSKLLKGFANIEYGEFQFTSPDGESYVFKGKMPGPVGVMTVYDGQVVKEALKSGDIGLGETYMMGLWDSPNVDDLFQMFLLNMSVFEKFAHGNIMMRFVYSFLNSFIRKNTKKRSLKNISFHYDLSNEFYRLWLDPSMTYSSALFNSDKETLESAQDAKYKRILDNLDGEPDNILEIGCGWGGFADKAREAGKKLKGLTLSEKQLDYAVNRLAKYGNKDIRLVFQDYRDEKGIYDAVVSIEMFEAVGEKYWKRYFDTIKKSLARGGSAMIQTIVIKDEEFKNYRKRGDFIRRYTFPGGMLPSVETIKNEVEKAGLQLEEIFTFGKDYAKTMRIWKANFLKHLDEIKTMGFTNEFIRGWLFYLDICAAAFENGRTNVVQVKLVNS